MTVAGGRVVSRPMNGAVEGMLAVLEDPRPRTPTRRSRAWSTATRREGPEVLRPYKDRFRKMLTDRDPGVRQVAAWALGRTGDLDVVPALIDAPGRPRRAEVVDAARLGLQLLSRKIDGLGPPIPSTPEQRQQAARPVAGLVRGDPPARALEGEDVEASRRPASRHARRRSPVARRPSP